jgi:phage terminase large subunit
MFRGPDGPPPSSIIIETGWEENPWLSEESKAQIVDLFAKNPGKARHIYGGGYVEEIEGAYYANELAACRKAGRIGYLVPDRAFPLRTYWDLGNSDWTVIIVCQFVGDRIIVLDYLAGQNQPPSYYMAWLRENEYDHALCFLPHDGAHVHAENPISMSYEAQLKAAGFKAKVIPNQGKGAARQRIDVTKELFARIWFQEDTTRPLIKALGAYHEKLHEKTKIGLGPEHDWASHPADAFGLMGIDYKPPRSTVGRATHAASSARILG